MIANIKDRIKKLLRVAAEGSGATEAEASTAMEMATSLMIKYNLEVDLNSDEIKMIEGTAYDCNNTWCMFLTAAVCDLYSTASIRVTERKGRSRVKFIGRESNVDAAEQTYSWLINQVEALYKENLPSGLTQSERAEFRRTFKYSCALKIALRARAIIDTYKQPSSSGKDLMIIESLKSEAIDYFSKLYPETKQVSIRSHTLGNGSIAGNQAGETVQLNRSVKEQRKQLGYANG